MRLSVFFSPGWILIASLLLGPFSFIEAQGSDLEPGTPAYDEYANQIRDRLASRDGLEQVYRRAFARQTQLKSGLSSLRAMSVSTAGDLQQRKARSDQRAAEIERELAQNRSVMERTSAKLRPIYDQLQNDLKRIAASENDTLKQQIGTLIGASGSTVVPIWNRLTESGQDQAQAAGVARQPRGPTQDGGISGDHSSGNPRQTGRSDIAALTERMNRAHAQYLSCVAAGNQTKASLKLREYRELKTGLQQLRQSATPEGPSNSRESK